MLALWLAAGAALPARHHAHAAELGAAGSPFCLVLQSGDAEAAWRSIDALAAIECDALVSHGAGVVEGIAPSHRLNALSRLDGVRKVFVGPVGVKQLEAAEDDVRRRLRLWNYQLAQAAENRGKSDSRREGAALSEGACVALPPIPIPERADKVGGRPELPRLPKYNNVWGADDYQTSEFFLGRIVVGIVTPDVGGGQWTETDLLAAHAGVRDAMLYWKAQAQKWSDAPVYLAFEYLDALPTTKSPLTASNETSWVAPLMAAARERLGITTPSPLAKIPDQTFPEVYQVLNFLRKKYVADWAYFAVIGRGDRFTEQPGLGAYAFLGGPLLVAPNRPVNWSLPDLLIHESGHIFYALDEYEAGRGTSSPCGAVSGYLAAVNRNSLNRVGGGCVSSSVPCAMARPAPRSCSYSLAMMGVHDSDGDGIRDVLDTQPIVDLATRENAAVFDSLGRRALSDTIRTLTPEFAGIVRDSPLGNRIVIQGVGATSAGDSPIEGDPLLALAGRPPVTMNRVASAEYRIDEGPWTWIRPDSSGYDAPVEDFRILLEGLSGGTHTVYFRGTNTIGNATDKNAMTKHKLVVLAVALDQLEVIHRREGGLNVTWRVRGEAWDSSARLYRSEDSQPEALLSTVALRSDAAFAYFDAAVKPGHRYTYRVETDAFGKRYALSADAVAAVPIRGADSRLSLANPNPFRTETFLSFSVPEGLLVPIPPNSGGNKPGPPPELPTSPLFETAPAAPIEYERLNVYVRVTIHDVTGRRVRSLYDGSLYGSRIYTTRWDGTDDDGEPLSAGVYFTRLEAGTFLDTNKIVLVR